MTEILFLCSGNYYRSRMAESMWVQEARQRGLNIQASSAGLCRDLNSFGNPGPLSPIALRLLKEHGYNPHRAEEVPQVLDQNKLGNELRLIALSEREHRPLVEKEWPELAERIEYWEVGDIGVDVPESAYRKIHQGIQALLLEALDAQSEQAQVPMQWIGPMTLIEEGGEAEECEVPLATYESPLWPSTRRGARVCSRAGGIRCTLLDARMTRSVILEAKDASSALKLAHYCQLHQEKLQSWVAASSRFARLLEVSHQIVGNLLYLRFAFFTGDASGHNMATLAAESILNGLLSEHPEFAYVSLSGNLCTDKKVSAVNGILGRGRSVVAECLISEKLLKRFLRCSAADLVALNLRKNLMGSLLAGSLRSANAHVANILLAFYLATGQDAANIVEGSQAQLLCEDRDGDLYVSLTLPHLIVGSIGNGKGLPFVEENLRRLGCREDRDPGENANRLARICAAACLCGELSLMAALCNQGELMEAHQRLER